MRGNEFLDSLEFINLALIEAADELPKRRAMWLRWGGLAACLCVVATAFALRVPYKGPGGFGFLANPSASPAVSDEPLESDPHSADRPRELTSDTYSSLEELLDYLSLHDGHKNGNTDSAGGPPKLVGKDGMSVENNWQTGRDVVSYEGVVYQIVKGDPLYNEKNVAIFQDSVEIGRVDLATPPEALYLTDGKLIVVGRLQSNTELDPDPEDYGTAVTIYSLSNPQNPVQTDVYHQRGAWAACWVSNGRLWLITLDGVCACGYSRLDDLADYKPQLAHNGELIPWPEEDICILGEPTQAKYAAISCVDLDDSTVLHKRACYGDISDVFFGQDWFALITQSTVEGGAYSLQKMYTFDGSMSFTGKCDVAAMFGLEGTGKLEKGNVAPPEYPDVKAVTREDGIWRMVGEYVRRTEAGLSKELFVVAFDPNGPQPIAKEQIQLSTERFDIDDVVWEDGRAIITAGSSDEAQLVFAEFCGMDISLLTSDLVCDRVRGVDGIYWYGSPLGYLKPFILLGDGLYLRYNETPDGFVLYDLSDSANPKCLYKSQGDIPEGSRLDFVNYVITDRTVVVQFIPQAQASSCYGPEEVCTWAGFTIAPDSDAPVLMLWEKQIPLTGVDPLDYNFFAPSDDV